jgi:hypothetical protein
MEYTGMLVSDEEREETVGLLHRHMLAGRITSDELEERVAEAWAGRTEAHLDHAMRGLPPRRPPAVAAVAMGPPRFVAPPRQSGAAGASLACAIAALTLLTFTLGFAAILTLPLAGTAWVLGRDARRAPGGGGSAAAAGHLLGIIGVGLSAMALFSWFVVAFGF